MSNVIRLPRPSSSRPNGAKPGLYFRVGYNQHRDVLDLLSSGVHDFHGIVIDATNLERHVELKTRALEVGLDVVLDPKTFAMAFPGGHSKSMASLPWGLERPHTYADFGGDKGKAIALEIAEFATENQFTQVIGPAHVLSGANDKWLRRDIELMAQMRLALDADGSDIQMIYPLSLPMQVFRDPLERAAIVAALADSPMDAIWLRIENFGTDATGEKTVAYIQAACELQNLGVPMIADHVGGLSALGLLAFGSVGGLSHGITLYENFKTSSWRKPPEEGRRSGGIATRVYVPRLDMVLKPEDAKAFLNSSTRTKGRFGCRDSHCCPGGLNDMLDNPTRHYVYQRSEEVNNIASVPESARGSTYLDRYVRPISDNVSAAASLGAISDEMRKKLEQKQKRLGRYRQSIGHLVEVDNMRGEPILPKKRSERK